MNGGAGNGPEPFNPFPGLRAFEADEDYLFFGREQRTDELLHRLRTSHFLAVIGPSGCGKSSLVRAGLIPSLHSGLMSGAGSSWRVATVLPGENPIGNLAAALSAPQVLGTDDEAPATRRVILEASLRASALGLLDAVRQARLPAGDNLLLVVDQFEELFRFKRQRGSADQAVAFVKLLLAASAQEELPLYVVITMRSDFIGDCMEFPGLPEAINRGQYLVARMSRTELRSAITGPIAVGGGTITPRLLVHLLNDVGDNTDQLPVLQHVLMRLWNRWQRDRDPREPLDLEDYAAVGTLREALSLHAEEAYTELPSPAARAIAEKAFKALTHVDAGGQRIRRPCTVAELMAVTGTTQSEILAVLEPFRRAGRSFLRPPADQEIELESVVDLSHESLIRVWRRLVGWVDEEKRSCDYYRRVATAAARYRAGEAGLWQDPQLGLHLRWRDRAAPIPAWAERYAPGFDSAMRFLDESHRALEASRRRQRLILYALAAVAMLVVILVGALLWYRNVQQARFNDRLEGLAKEADSTILALEEEREILQRDTSDLLKEVDRLRGVVEAATSGPLQVSPGAGGGQPGLEDLRRELQSFESFVSKSDTRLTEQKLKTDGRIDSFKRGRAEVWQPSSEEVEWLQERLNAVAGTDLKVNGVLGSETRRALVALQARHDLSPDGILGPATRQLLEKLPERSPVGGAAAAAVPEAIVELVARQLEVEPGQLDVDLSFDETGLDREDRALIARSIKRQFDLAIPDQTLQRFRSLGDLIGYVEDPKGWRPPPEPVLALPPPFAAAQPRCRAVEVREKREATIPEWGVLLSAGEIEDLYLEDLEVRLGRSLGTVKQAADWQELAVGGDEFRLRLVEAIDRGLGQPDTAQFEVCSAQGDCLTAGVRENRSTVLKEWQLQIGVGEVERGVVEGVEAADLAVWRQERLEEGEGRKFSLRGRRFSITLVDGHDVGLDGPAGQRRTYRRDFASLELCRLGS